MWPELDTEAPADKKRQPLGDDYVLAAKDALKSIYCGPCFKKFNSVHQKLNTLQTYDRNSEAVALVAKNMGARQRFLTCFAFVIVDIYLFYSVVCGLWIVRWLYLGRLPWSRERPCSRRQQGGGPVAPPLFGPQDCTRQRLLCAFVSRERVRLPF